MSRPVWKPLASILLVVLCALLCYKNILFVSSNIPLYPWASDTLGHAIKAEYLARQMAQGHWYPDIFPNWYVGVQMLRYYPPLPYYLLVALAGLAGNSVVAANWAIALCALAGGLAWLPYKRWIGRLPAAAGGVLYLFLPDNVRVALAEGNIPRVLATALLPLAVYFLLRVLEEDKARWLRVWLALCFAAIVLCHAMMAAIYAACCVLLALLCWAWRATTMRRAIMVVASMALGIMLSGWWLVPSLTGGITELDVSAMTEALAVFSLTTYLNPMLRAGNPEIVYPGAALLITALVMPFIHWRFTTPPRDGRPIALALAGLFGVLISTPGFNTVFNALPLHNLFWPLRFLGIASFMLLLAVMWQVGDLVERADLPGLRRSKWLYGLAAIPILLAADGALSLRLIHLRPAREEVSDIAGRLPALSGWREATLDHSKLGSAASYFFTSVGGREQLYGWAYQGARTARNVAAINEGMQRGYADYVLDRLALLGADDVVLLQDSDIDPDLPAVLKKAGFVSLYDGPEVTLCHRDGAPRAYRANWPALGIGRGAQNLAFLFPQLVVGGRTRLDEYALDELTAFQTVFLSGFQWNSRDKAEDLIKQAAHAGVRIVVDLTGVPAEPLAREPHFLGVWGEPITLQAGAIQLLSDDPSLPLRSLSVPFGQWQTYTPQGLQVEVLYHNYLGAKSTVLGYNEYNGGQVWFVGLNLPYHAALTGDAAIVALLADLLQLPAQQGNDYQAVPLADYVPSQAGYDFMYTLDAADVLLAPVAFHEGTVVRVDGQPVRARSFENLVAFDAPAGQHQVTVRVRKTIIYTLGMAASGVALLSIIGLLNYERAWQKQK